MTNRAILTEGANGRWRARYATSPEYVRDARGAVETWASAAEALSALLKRGFVVSLGRTERAAVQP